eukprot:4754556-Pyramimonas_sp.AAC.1
MRTNASQCVIRRVVRVAWLVTARQVFEFRDYFRKTSPSAVGNFTSDAALKLDHVDPAFDVLDHFHHGSASEHFKFGSVTEIFEESRRLNESQELFEIFVSDYVDLRRCNEELTYMKGLWDQVGAVLYTFTDWYSTPWDSIDV